MMSEAYGFHGWGLGWIFMILVWSVLILGVVALSAGCRARRRPTEEPR